MTRPHSPATYNALCTAWKRLVQTLGGIEATAACVRVGKSQVSLYGDTSKTDETSVPIDVVLDAETIAGQPFVTQALASIQGYTLLPVAPRDAGDLSLTLIRISRDVANLFTHAGEALADHRLDDVERGVLAADLDEIVRTVSEARQLIASGGAHASRQA